MFANLFEDKKSQEIEMPADGISLDLLRAVYRNNQLPLTTRMRAAIAALPFEVPKLAVTAVVSEQDFATVLDRRLRRIEEMKLLENKAVNGDTTVSDRTIDPEPQPAPAPLNRIYDKRRYRRI
jgi:hypothetical protein